LLQLKSVLVYATSRRKIVFYLQFGAHRNAHASGFIAKCDLEDEFGIGWVEGG
jgi:hypothetical protein